ncbi:MAG: MCP four helix bundle domain-containing protein [Polyangiaceae bacterium]|nr:MCP four helix bundle domain-containing protein [Polyangiaceae bacterium]
MKWTIRNKMLAGFLVKASLAITLAVVAVYQTGIVRDATMEIAAKLVPSTDLIGQLSTAQSEHRKYQLMHIDAPTEAERARFEAELTDLERSIDMWMQQYEKLVSTQEERLLFDAYVKAYRALMAEAELILAESRKGARDEARKDFFGTSRQLWLESEAATQALVKYEQRQGATAVQTALGAYGQARLVVLTTAALAVAISLAVALWLSGSIAAPISRMAEIFRKIAAGDAQGAAAELKLMGGSAERGQAQDEVGSLVVSARDMEAFREAVAKSLREGVNKLAASTAQIGVTAKQYAETSTEQATAVAEVSTTVEEIKQTSEVAAAGAREVAQAADEAAKNGITGRERLNDAVGVMQTIYQRVSGIAEQILKLSDQTSQIGTIVDAVSDLAEQSNLLAVNASIEAAKAGEQGRGFSVVASEVRSLADQSKRATQQIRGILAQIQKATQSAVMATEEGAKRSEDGRHAVEAVREVMENLATVLGESSAKARQIAGASAQQASGIAQIAAALAGISKATRDNAAGVRQLEAAVVDLERLAVDLRSRSEGF